MNRLLLFFISCIFAFSAGAQNYKFMYSTGSYTEITGGTPILQATGAFNDSLILPYNFTIDGVTSKKLWVLINGRITTGAYSVTSLWFWAFEGAEISHGTCTYQTSGSNGNRITKIQYKNNWFDHEWGNGNQSRCNFQVWLYEKDSAIEVHYGPSNIVDAVGCYQGAPGPAVGLPGLFANGSAASPSGTATAAYLVGTPPNGAIYRFGPPVSAAGVSQYNTAKHGLRIYPVPAHDQLFVSSENGSRVDFEIYDVTGKKISSFVQQSTNTPVDISQLHSGMYILKTAEGSVSTFVKN
jgi:hypothetical protein